MKCEMKKEKLITRINKCRAAYLFVLPAVTLITVFKYYPFLQSVYQSLFQWNGANIHIFNGINNYVNLFQDEMFWDSLVNSVTYSLARVVVNLLFPFIAVELVAYMKGKKQNFFKMGFIVPMVVPMMVVTLLWQWILAGDYGVLNMGLRALGLEELVTPWLATSSTALGAILAIGFPWISGLPFLIYLAGRQNISESLYESAGIEGAGVWQKIRYIDIPLMASQRKLVIMFVFINSFQIFEMPLVLTNGGPGTATLTPALYLYQKAFNGNEFGYSATIGTIVFLILLMVTVFNQVVLKDRESNEG